MTSTPLAKKFLSLSLLFSSCLAIAADYSKSTPEIVVSEAAIMAVPTSAKETLAVMKLSNKSSKAVTIISAYSDIVKTTSLMKTISSNNMMGMIPINSIVVPAYGSVTLKGSGYHIMLTDLKRSLKTSEVIKMSITTSDKNNINFTAIVKKF